MTNTVVTLEEILIKQREHWANVVTELLNGQKTTHWCWYFFPNVPGLGKSPEAQYFALEPDAFVEFFTTNSEYCGNILTVLALTDRAYRANKGLNLEAVLGEVDALKFKSFVTLVWNTYATSSYDADILPHRVCKILRHSNEVYGTCEHTGKYCREHFTY